MKKIAFVCETPYHLTNAVKIIFGIPEYRNSEVYLFLGNKFHDAKNVYNTLIKLDIFKGIALYDYNNINNQRYGRFLELFFPRKYLSQLCNNSPFLSLHFDYIFQPAYLYFGVCLLRIKPKSKYCMFEDGLATYFGAEVMGIYSRLRRIIWWFQNVDRIHLRPSSLFLNMPELYGKKNGSNLCLNKIPDFDFEMKNLLYGIFNFVDNQLYHKYNLIYLSQPFLKNNFEDKNFIRRNEIFQSISKVSNGDLLLRFHPREKILHDLELESENTQNWELTSLNSITDSKILITSYSTAAFVPKFLYNKEPYVVFLYKLFEYPEYEISSIETMVRKLKNVYSDKDKIIIVENIDDLDSTLKSLISC